MSQIIKFPVEVTKIKPRKDKIIKINSNGYIFILSKTNSGVKLIAAPELAGISLNDVDRYRAALFDVSQQMGLMTWGYE